MNKNISKRNYDFFKKAEFLKFANAAASGILDAINQLKRFELDDFKKILSSFGDVRPANIDEILNNQENMKKSISSLESIIKLYKQNPDGAETFVQGLGLNSDQVMRYRLFLQKLAKAKDSPNDDIAREFNQLMSRYGGEIFETHNKLIAAESRLNIPELARIPSNTGDAQSVGKALDDTPSAVGAGRAAASPPSGPPSGPGGAGGLGGGGGGGGVGGAVGGAADAAVSLAGATRTLKLLERTPTINEILFSIGIITSIAWAAAGLFSAYLLFSDEEKEQSNDAIGRIIGCLQNIPVDPSSEAMNLKRSLISKLSFLRDNINGESGESGKLISEIFDKDGLMQNFTGSVVTGKNVDINDSYTMENLSQDIACVSDASSELVNLAKSNSEVTASDYPTGTKRPTGPSLGGSDQVGPAYTGSGGGTQDGSISNVTANSIVVNVTLSTGETYQVPISTKKPSIPQRFILYLANGRGPDNFFASPTFAAFVDPDQSSPIGGSGLVPNAIGSQNIEDRIASAIKYCYNNDIDSAIELRRFMIRQINSGVGFLKKLFTNEPEQRVLDRAIGFYASGSASSGDISEPMSRREMRQDRRERRMVDRANRRASDFSDNIIKNSQKNNESINKEDSAMNKLAQKKNKVDAYEYAVKGLEDSLTKAYYAGLNSMYNEKPKDKKKDLKDLYNIDEEGGIKAIQSAHPKSVHVGESMGDGSLIENSLEQQYKTEQKLLPTPTGNFTSKNAFFQYLHKLRKVAEDSGKKEAFELINETINKLEKI